METKFNSQICTSKSQSEALLKLGLKKETADIRGVEGIEHTPTYAWSLHRLIEMIPTHIYQGEHEFYRTIKPHSILYMPVDMESMWSIGRVVVNTNNYYDGIIEMYEWLIKEGYFNKEYLV